MTSRPNILLIMSDQHNPHVMGCAGDSVVRTPNLDALARTGVRFANTYCASPLCVPSRMSFLTGRYPSDIGVCTNAALFDSNIPTFAHALALEGYDTTLCGRMHFGGADQHHGFARRLVGDVSGARDQSQALFENMIPQHCCGQGWESVRDSGYGQTTYMAYDRAVTRRACAELLKEGDDGRIEDGGWPWCMVVGYLLPHNPYICPKDLFDQYMDKVSLPEVDPDELNALHPAMKQWRDYRGVDKLSREDQKRARAAYYGLVTYMDQQIGQVLSALEKSGQADNTVVIYVSDHGEMAGEHGLWWKDSFYEGSVSVPMIWRWPGQFAQSAVVNEVASLLDIAPTLTQLGGAEELPGQRGRSLVSALLGEDDGRDARPTIIPSQRTGRQAASGTLENQAFSEINPIGLWPARMIRRGPWKLNSYHGFERPQLFNLKEDPNEQHNLGTDLKYAQIRKTLEAAVLADWSGEDIKKQTQQREQAFHIMRRFHAEHPTGESETWRIPAGSNSWNNGAAR